MKRILLPCIMLIGLATISKAQGVFQLIKKNGSATGFNHIQQTTDSLGNSRMTCIGAGNSKAEFVKPPNDITQTDINTVIRFADNQIKKGKLSGTAMAHGMQIKWEGSDTYNYTLTATPEKSGKN